MTNSILHNITAYIKKCNLITLIFAVVMSCRLTGFISIPSVVIYSLFIIYAIYIISQGTGKYYTPIVIFLIYIVFQLSVLDPDPMFKSWERFSLFVLLMICVSPLIENRTVMKYRQQIFIISIFSCTILAIGSFFARFLGINFFTRNTYDYLNNAGFFGGLANHSMTLGIIGAIASVYCAYKAFTNSDKRKLFIIFTIFCVGAVLFSASRAAFIALLGGMIIMIFRLSGSHTRFFKILVGVSMIGLVTFPLWNSSLDSLISKNNKNKNLGSVYSSRDELWNDRIEEFKHHPILGVGFDAIDISNNTYISGFNRKTGQIESGSSWLTIFSMTGCIGAAIIIPMFVSCYIKVFKGRRVRDCLICGILTVFYLHMFAEGYLFYGGSPEGFILWSTIAAAHDS